MSRHARVWEFRIDIAGDVGLKLVVLDAIDDDGSEAFTRRKEFSCRLGFHRFCGGRERKFITIGTIRSMFGQGKWNSVR